MSDTCIRNISWVGKCGKTAVRTNPLLCASHYQDICWCLKPATRDCANAGSLVCGRPLCDEHECNVASHSLRGSQQYNTWAGKDSRKPRTPEDPNKVYIVAPPAPCAHGNGSNCDCQLPWYAGLFVVPITFKHDGKARHIVARMRQTHGGGMREFLDPVSGDVVGSCGTDWAASHVVTAEFFIANTDRK